jgi:lipoate-protein ligase A
MEPGERKVSGTAARISHGRAYHHLTLLVHVDLCRLRDSLRSPYKQQIETTATRSVPAKAVGYLQQEVHVDVQSVHQRMIKAVRQQFEDVDYKEIEQPLNENTYPGVTSSYNLLQSRQWIFGKCPEFSVTLKTDGNDYKVHVKDDIIRESDTRCYPKGSVFSLFLAK